MGSERLRRRIVDGGKRLLVETNRSRPLRFMGERTYDLMQLVITRRLGAMPGVEAVYLCHSLAMGECYPGLSDFDIALVFDGRDPLSFYDRVRQRWGLLKRYFPISDLSLLTVDEFETWQRVGGGWDPLDEVRHWKLLSGRELRQTHFDASAEEAAMDRMQWALGHFQNLLGVAIKEEQRSPLMAVVARRQLHKNFWNTVTALDPKYLAMPTHRARVTAWKRDNGNPPVVKAMQQMYDDRFMAGPVTTARFDAAALAYRLLDESLSNSRLIARPLSRPAVAGEQIPISNHEVVEERGHAFAASLLDILGGSIHSVMISSTGSVRGYAFYIVLRDGLSLEEIASALRDIRAVHRVFDDPWFNEHFPGGIPVVCSQAMFIARLHTGRSTLRYFEKFRCILHGEDLYLAALGAETQDAPGEREHERTRDQLLYSLYIHQVYLAWIKPALYDYVTFYYPRLFLQQARGIAPATAEEASAQFGQVEIDDSRAIPQRMLEQYRGKDLDSLLKTMTRDTFTEVWPLLSRGLHHRDPTP